MWAAITMLAGIVTVPGGFYVTNEGGGTAPDGSQGVSTYGPVDANSGYFNGTFYTDITGDDDDPVLFVAESPAADPPRSERH